MFYNGNRGFGFSSRVGVGRLPIIGLILLFWSVFFLVGCTSTSCGARKSCGASTGISIFVGQGGGAGNVDGVGARARFRLPSGIAVTGAGDVFVADRENNTIRMISTSGIVSTIAGKAGSRGLVDGLGINARFNRPESLVVDGANDVYVVDMGNRSVRKINTKGMVTTLATPKIDFGKEYDEGGLSFAFTVDLMGNIYWASGSKSIIYKMTTDGKVMELLGSSGTVGTQSSEDTESRYVPPNSIAVDNSGNIYVLEAGQGLIHKLSPDGSISKVAGSDAGFNAVNGAWHGPVLSNPSHLVCDREGNLYVVDRSGSAIKKIDTKGRLIDLVGADEGASNVERSTGGDNFSQIDGLAVDSAGNMYVTDSDGHAVNAIRKISKSGKISTLAGSMGFNFGVSDFRYPEGVSADVFGNLFVADGEDSTIKKISSVGEVTVLAGSSGGTGAEDGIGGQAYFNFPLGVATDKNGNIFVTDAGNGSVRKITPGGVVTTLVGMTRGLGSADSVGQDTHFSIISGLAVDEHGNVFVVDSGSIKKINMAGSVSIFASIESDYKSILAEFPDWRSATLWSLALDADGNIYEADMLDNVIRKITSAGGVSVFAGRNYRARESGDCLAADGYRDVARFCWPTGLTVDKAGNVYVADSGNSTIRKISPAGSVTTVAGVAGHSGLVSGPLSSTLNKMMGITMSRDGILYVTTEHAVVKIILQ